MEDERYKRGQIYTIRNIKDDTMIYVGSTINSLSKRFHKHKIECKGGISCVTLYSYIIDNDWSGWYIELYEAYPCNNKKELERREGQIIREIGTINKNIAGRTIKEYREDNKEEIIQKKKEYYERNKEEINEKRSEKLCCDICGAFSTKPNLAKHQRTKKCMEALNNTTSNIQDCE